LGDVGIGQTNGSVMKVPVNGSSSAIPLASDQTNPEAIAIDASSVYWTVLCDAQLNPNTGEIRKVPLGGGAPVPLATGENYPTTIAVDSTSVYWGSTAADLGYVNKVGRMGGPVAPVIPPTTNSGMSGLASDGTNLYLADWSASTVGRVPVGGGTMATIADKQGGLWGIATDATYIYWATTYDNAVRKAPLGSMLAATDVATGQAAPKEVAVDASGIYWTNSGDGTIMKAPLSGGPPTTLAQGQKNPAGIALDVTSVYWVNAVANGAVMKLTK
jgi:hypothetical protein